MKVAVFGATGFVGGYLVDALIAAGHKPTVLVRNGSVTKLRQPQHCKISKGDIGSTDAISSTLRGCDAAIYNIGILREYTGKGMTFTELQYEGAVRVIEAMQKAGVKRLLLMSANGVEARQTRYQQSKARAEQAALESDLDVTIFAPSVIFGDPRGCMEFATQLWRDMIRPPLPAVSFFSGALPDNRSLPMSPVAATDVADAFVAALADRDTVGQRYVLAGPRTVSWSETLRTVAAAADRRKWQLPMPVALMKLAAKLLDWLPVFPVTYEQLVMLEQGNTGDSGPLEKLIRREPVAFDAGHLAYLKNDS